MVQNVPEARLGSSVTCPRCRNSFTLAPMVNPPALPPREPRIVPRKAAPAPPVAVIEKPAPRPAVAPEPVEDDAPAVQPPSVEEILAEPSGAADAPPLSVTHATNYPGLAAFLLGSFAFLAAAVLHRGGITFGLGLAGLVLGLVGFLVAGAPRRLVLPAAGVAASLAAVVVAVFLPQWLGLSPLWSPPKPPDQPGEAVMALSGAGGLRPVEDGEVAWVDASRDALLHGDVRLRVSSATVGPAAFEPVPGQKPPSERCLTIGLRITNAGIVRKVNYTSWGGAAPGRPRLVLRDNQGRTYPEKAFSFGWVVKGRTATASIPPGKTLDDVLVFEAPPAAVEYLRLELPGSAVGAEGPFRMEVPRSMIVFR
jgi:hypothetical protein